MNLCYSGFILICLALEVSSSQIRSISNDGTSFFCNICLIKDKNGKDMFAGRGARPSCWKLMPAESHSVKAGELWSIECAPSSAVATAAQIPQGVGQWENKQLTTPTVIDVRVGHVHIESDTDYPLTTFISSLQTERHIQARQSSGERVAQEQLLSLLYPRKVQVVEIPVELELKL